MSTKRKRPDPATDGRKSTQMEDWAWQWDQRLMPVGRFIDAVDRSEGPAIEDMQFLATALRAFFCHRDTDASLAEFASKLGLTRKQGRREPTFGESKKAFGAAISMAMFEQESLTAGETATRARASAIRKVAGRERIPLRTAQSWCKQWGELARAIVTLPSERATKTRE